jgi:hypothetical protein
MRALVVELIQALREIAGQLAYIAEAIQDSTRRGPQE